MPIIRSTRPTLDVDINIFHSLYPVGRERWHTVLLMTDDPGPNPGKATIYSDLAELRKDYPEVSVTYKAARQFFQQPNADDLWVLPVTGANGALPTALDWATALHDYIARHGLSFYYLVATTGDEVVVEELADAASAYEIITIIRNSAGARASVTTGSGPSALTWTMREEGEVGNKSTLTYVVPEQADAPLRITWTPKPDGGYDIVVYLATDSNGAPKSTAAEIAAKVAQDPQLSFIVHVAAGGDGVVEAQPRTPFTGGGVGASTIESFGRVLADLASPRVFGIMHDQPARYFPDVCAAALFSTMNPGSFTPKNRILEGIPPAQYTPTEFSAMREANINSIFRNPAGHINITDGFASNGLFIDIQMAIDVMAHWQRVALWDLLSQPPAGYHKIPYDNDGFMMIVDRLYSTLARGARPEWNFIVSRHGKPACRIIAPSLEEIDPEDRKNRIYRPRWEATFKGAVHEIEVRGYLTVEFIPPTEARLGSGIEFTYT